MSLEEREHRSALELPRLCGAPHSRGNSSLPVPPLMDQEIWDAAQRSLSQAKVFPAREVTFPYLLRGLARCGQCGGAMRCHTSAQRQGANPYYHDP